MHSALASLLKPAKPLCVFESKAKTSPRAPPSCFRKSAAHNSRQTVCNVQQDSAQKLGRGVAAIAASALILLSSGASLADVGVCAAETSNATVEASASVNAVMGEQNETVQRSDAQSKQQVQDKAPLSAQQKQ